MDIYFLDTSAILNKGLYTYRQSYISPLTLSELENIKTSKIKDEDIKYRARVATRYIIQSDCIHVSLLPIKTIERALRRFDFLENINDHKIIINAELLGKKDTVYFVTSDATQYLLAQQMPHLQVIFLQDTENENDSTTSEYCGWGKYYPDERQMNFLYSDPKINILGCHINEFAEIFENDKLKDILFWDGNQYQPLTYHNIKNHYLGETIIPRNTEQKMACALLQNQNIKVKLLTSAWGGGKTLLALNYALEQIGRGIYQKLVFIRNNIIAAGTKDIGFLPGNVREKLSIFARCIADHVGGEEELDRLIDEGVIETIPLSHIRGRSLRDSIVLVDECENLDTSLVTLIMSRIEENSELIFCGDVAQIDDPRFEKNNGIRALINHLAGDPLFGMVKLIKSERGPVAALCDKIKPPI